MTSRRRLMRMLMGLAAATAGGWAVVSGGRPNRYYTGPPSDHFDGMRFYNPGGPRPKGPGAFLKWQFGDSGEAWPARFASPFPQDRPPARFDGAGARIVFVGHASFLIQTRGRNVLIDPVWSERASPLSFIGPLRVNAPGIAWEQLPNIDAVLVTHNHYDHLDLPTLHAVGAPVVAGLGTRATLKGLPCTELAWWDRMNVGGLTVSFVPGQHWSRRGLGDINEALWGGFVVETGDACVYHAGDTAYFSGFQDIGRRFPGLDAALLPIGAYDPEWFMRSQHMNPGDATQAFLDLGARLLVPMHWGTFKLTDEPLDEPPKLLGAEWERRKLPPQALCILPIGGSLEVRGAASAGQARQPAS